MHKLSVHGAVGSNRRRRFLFWIVIDDEPQPGPFSPSIACGPQIRRALGQPNHASDSYGDAPRFRKLGFLQRIVGQTIANPRRRPFENGCGFGDGHRGAGTPLIYVFKRLAHGDALALGRRRD
jgi:hypothetical protein